MKHTIQLLPQLQEEEKWSDRSKCAALGRCRRNVGSTINSMKLCKGCCRSRILYNSSASKNRVFFKISAISNQFYMTLVYEENAKYGLTDAWGGSWVFTCILHTKKSQAFLEVCQQHMKEFHMYCATLCKIVAPTDTNCGNESKNCTTSKI